MWCNLVSMIALGAIGEVRILHSRPFCLKIICGDKDMAMEKKVKTMEEKAFNKRWNKLLKLSPMLKNVSKDVGKAPKCGVKAKTESVVVTPTKKKK